MKKRFDSHLDQLQMPPTPALPAARMDTHVDIPFKWSLITAIILTGLLLYVVKLLGGKWDPVLIFLVVLAVSWGATSIPFWVRLLWKAETRLNLDLDGDGYKGDPWDAHHLHVTVDGYEDDLPFDTKSMGWNYNAAILFSRAVVNIDDLTEGRWGKRSAAFPGGKTQFKRIRAILEEQGYIERTGRYKNATWALTDKGHEAFEAIAALPVRQD